MFERFTERARQVVVLAQAEARELRHNYIGTEHLLLGLLREEDGIAARVLAARSVTVDRVRSELVRAVGQGDEVVIGPIPFTSRTKKVLELSLREALSHGHNYIGTEHVLMGLLREGEGVACRILTELGADAELLHSEVVAALGGPAVAPRPVPGRRVERPRGRQLPPVALLAAGWLLFALALCVGILIGWAIWG